MDERYFIKGFTPMATIIKRRKALSVVYDMDGKTIHETYYNYKTANKRKKQIENDQFDLLVDEETLIVDYLYFYMNTKGKDIWSIKTYEFFVSIIHNYLSIAFKDDKISDLNDEYIREVFKSIKEMPSVEDPSKKITDYMIEKVRVVLKYAFNELTDRNIIDSNPINFIKPKKKKNKNKKKTPINTKYLDKLFTKCDDQRLFVIMHLMLGTYITMNELLGLTIDDIHVEDNLFINQQCYIRINKVLDRIQLDNLSKLEGRIIDKANNKGMTETNTQLTLYKIEERKEPINNYIASILRKYIKQKKLINHKYLISKSNGEFMDRRVLSRDLDNLLNKCKLKHITFRDIQVYGRELSDDDLTKGELFYSNLSTPYLLPDNDERMKAGSICKELQETLPTTDQQTVNRFVDALKDDKELKMELMTRLKELL